jgi:hypothetical protein
VRLFFEKPHLKQYNIQEYINLSISGNVLGLYWENFGNIILLSVVFFIVINKNFWEYIGIFLGTHGNDVGTRIFLNKEHIFEGKVRTKQ